jgi:hypothetical protein
LSRRAHTRTNTLTLPATPRRPDPKAALSGATSSAPRPTPAPANRGAEALHSPEFLHVCGRGLRETKQGGQQAGGVRSAAAPGGTGHSRARRRGTPCGSVRGKPGRALPRPVPPAVTQWALWAEARVTGEPARAAALPGTELRPPGLTGGQPRTRDATARGALGLARRRGTLPVPVNSRWPLPPPHR